MPDDPNISSAPASAICDATLDLDDADNDVASSWAWSAELQHIDLLAMSGRGNLNDGEDAKTDRLAIHMVRTLMTLWRVNPQPLRLIALMASEAAGRSCEMASREDFDYDFIPRLPLALKRLQDMGQIEIMNLRGNRGPMIVKGALWVEEPPYPAKIEYCDFKEDGA